MRLRREIYSCTHSSKSCLLLCRFDRVAAEEFTLKGVTIPKGMVITASGYGCHMDPDVWDQPRSFIPERWRSYRISYTIALLSMKSIASNHQTSVNREFSTLAWSLSKWLQSYRQQEWICWPSIPTVFKNWLPSSILQISPGEQPVWIPRLIHAVWNR